MKIIAFDLGAHLAWASRVQVSHREFPGLRTTRLCSILEFLTQFNWKDFTAVVYETPLTRGQGATRSLWGIAGILEAVTTRAGLPILDVAVPTIKKFATGNGFASKLEMLKAARKRFGYVGSNEHEADAVCLWNYAEAHLEVASW